MSLAPSDCRCHLLPPGEPCEACWASHLADLDDAGGWPDELPQLPESAYFDAADLAELFEPTEADARWHAEQTKGRE